MAEQALKRFSHDASEKPVVLIVDDSRVVRVSLRNILKDDYLLVEAKNGDEAWQHLCKNPSIKIVFSDLSMPKLDGRGLLSRVRNAESSHLADLPFIIVTGVEASSEITQELKILGATGVVSKPFDPSLITNFISNLSAQISENELSDSQETDPQTDFLENTVNRTQFMEIASRELSFAIRNKNELALASLQIDQFSEILEHYSEPAVEHILLAMHDIIHQRIHPDDTLAYFGGGRFVMLRPASNAIGTRYLGRRILEDLSAKHFYLGESDQAVSASIGISAPDIKPGTLLRDLLILAEGRLTAAMDSGGGRVIDKGNENLTPVPTSQNSSELSGIVSTRTSDTSHFSHHNPTDTHRPAEGQATEIKSKYTINKKQDTDQEASQIAQYKQAIEELTTENRNLINEVEHWKKKSSEAESLRRQLFEAESQHQQVKMKFNELSEAHESLVKRSELVEVEKRHLIDDEEARTASLRDAHNFIEDENRRLESQIQALTSRAEKAELESLQLSQLVSSLRDNGNLLRMQLDQLQQQLDETQRAQQTGPNRVNKSSHLQKESSQLQTDSTILNNIYESELTLSATPEIPTPDSKQPSVDPFPEKEQITAIEKASLPFHVESEPIFFKDRFNPTSFQIASIILVGLLLIGFINIYLYLSENPTLETDDISQTIPHTMPAASESIRRHKPVTTKLPPQTKSVVQEDHDILKTSNEATISEELRLKKELTLRLMAEEEFNRKLSSPTQQNERLIDNELDLTKKPAQQQDALTNRAALFKQ
jgi:two-component system, cell cycle response regulator